MVRQIQRSIESCYAKGRAFAMSQMMELWISVAIVIKIRKFQRFFFSYGFV